MASWKDAPGQYIWGTYSNIGNYIKIYVVGGPGGGDSDYFYIPSDEMARLRSKNYATGIHFWWDGSSLKITINLIVLAARSDYQYITGDSNRYVGNSNTDYNFFANIQYQTKDGKWVKLGDHLVNTHYGGEPHYPAVGWDDGPGYLWNTFTFNDVDTDNIKQFSVGIHGDFDEVGNWAYYPIEKIKPVRPKKRLTIKYIDIETYRHLRNDDVLSVNADTLTIQAVPINGYTPREQSKDLILTGDTTYAFYYTKNKEYVDVTIRYLEKGTNRTLRNDMVVHRQEVGKVVSFGYETVNGYNPEQRTIEHAVNEISNIVIFYYSKNIIYVRPWAIRNSGLWKSFKTMNSNMKRRISYTFSNKSTEFDSSKSGETIPSYNLGNDSSVTQSSNYIRKSGSWKRQGKAGN